MNQEIGPTASPGGCERPSARGNRLLRLLSPPARTYLNAYRIERPISAGETLYREGEPFTSAIFPESGVVSLMAEMNDGRGVEKASIGNEGFVGFALILGGGAAISRNVVRVAGEASWIPLPVLDHALEEFPCVHDVMLRYAKSLVSQLLETVACTSLHTADQRVARWLLHAHDRVGENVFHLTQEGLSQALGLRRATVGAVCAALSSDGVIAYSRGAMTILDRARLQARSCECYGRISRAFDWQGNARWAHMT
jgi:CRP-like cAMP-binding protein